MVSGGKLKMFWNPLRALGTGVGIEVRGEDLAVALVKSRWKGVTVVGRTTLQDFRGRPAAEWGAEYQAFLKSHQFRDLPATLALPRGEVIVRLLKLPAVSNAELRAAVRYQIDSLHPYGDDNVYYGFAPLRGRLAPSSDAALGGPAGPSEVAVVIAARPVVDGYADLFAEAGVKLRGMTVAAAGYYGATRLLRRRTPDPFLIADQQDSAFELYGESATRPFFSAAFDAQAMPLQKAVAAAAAELRLPEEGNVPLLMCGETSGHSTLPAEEVLGSPLQAPSEFDLTRDATVFVTALAGACPRWGWRTNLLPPARRSSSARWPMAATAATAALVAAVALLLWLRGPIQDSRYVRELGREVKRLEAVEREVRGLERQTAKARSRRAQLEAFRRRPEADLALITELSRRLPKTVWITNIEVSEDAVQMVGQAESAAPLLGLLDASSVLTNAAFMSSITRNENREVFRIRSTRRTAAIPAGQAAGHGAAGPQHSPPAAGAHSRN